MSHVHVLHPPGGNGLALSVDMRTVSYTTDARHSSDVGAIQAKFPVPLSDHLFYYEITVIEQGEQGRIAIGYSDRAFSLKLNRQPGWEPGSYGYHGDDGKKFGGNGKGADYGPLFGKGDVVGALYHLGRQEISFTKNGMLLRPAFLNVKGELYPTIGLHSKGESVRVNFGNEPFVFDLDAYIEDEKIESARDVERIPTEDRCCHELIRQYLLGYGFGETLAAFDRESGAESPSPVAEGGSAMDYESASGNDADACDPSLASWITLSARREVRMAIMKGDAAGATEVITRKFPWVLASGSDRSPVSKDAQFMLAIQSYIELLRKGNIDQAVQYSQSYLSPLYSSVLGVPDKETLLREVVALIAYEQPELSPLSHLLDPQQQELTADSLNSAILSHHSSKTGLQELLEQLHRVEASLHEVAGNQGTLLPFELLMRNNNNNV